MAKMASACMAPPYLSKETQETTYRQEEEEEEEEGGVRFC
jgi:hypothetical protein